VDNDNDNGIPYIFRDHECCNQIKFFMAIKEVKSNPFLMFTLKRGLEMTVCNVLDILKQLSNLNERNFASQPTNSISKTQILNQPAPHLLPAVPLSAVQCSFTARDLSSASRVMVIQLSTVCLLNYFDFVCFVLFSLILIDTVVSFPRPWKFSNFPRSRYLFLRHVVLIRWRREEETVLP